MHQKRKHGGWSSGTARNKINATALRGTFIVGGVVWAMTGDFFIGVLATTLAAATCYVSGEMR